MRTFIEIVFNVLQDGLIPWVELILSASLVIATISIAYFAYTQNRIAKSNYKFAMYSKRYAVYEAIRKLIGKILRTGTADNNDFMEYYGCTFDAQFLFNDARILDYIRELGYKCNALAAECMMNNETGKRELFKWFKNQFNVSKKLFEPYLKLD